MTSDLERARRAEPAWDAVREQRVLGRVLAQTGAERSRRRPIAVGLAVAVALAAVVLLARPSAPTVVEVASPEVPGPSETLAPSGAAVEDREPGGAGTTAGHLALADGSQIELLDGARVEIVRDEATEVTIAHEAGSARFVVSHRPSRTFVVRCGEVEVVVRGTRFVVTRDEGVRVDVEEGRVEVRRGGDVTVLVAGESLRIEPRPAHEASVEVEAPAAPETLPTPPTRATEHEHGIEREAPGAGVDELLAEADLARRERRLPDAARALERAIALLHGDARAATPLFMLGRVERSRGRHAAAARAFEDAYARDPEAVLAEDALAESVVSFAEAGDRDTAARGAARYREHFPSGHYAARVAAAIE